VNLTHLSDIIGGEGERKVGEVNSSITTIPCDSTAAAGVGGGHGAVGGGGGRLVCHFSSVL